MTPTLLFLNDLHESADAERVIGMVQLVWLVEIARIDFDSAPSLSVGRVSASMWSTASNCWSGMRGGNGSVPGPCEVSM
jgi:hypothetical protein